MKISFRILLVNFIVVAVVVIGSTLAFFSLTKKLISFQHTKSLLNSGNDFVFIFQSVLQEIDDDFIAINSGYKNFSQSALDFYFQVNNDTTISLHKRYFSTNLIPKVDFESLQQFKNYYPGAIIKKNVSRDGKIIYYGKVLDNYFINSLSKKIRADIALLNDKIPIEISNPEENNNYFYNIIKASKTVLVKNSELFREETDRADFYASYYSPRDLHLSDNISFVIFSTLPEAAELRSNINKLLLIIGFAGVALSLILSMVFTDSIRKKIINLSKTAEIIKQGDLTRRVNISTKDELGQLGQTFNTMLDEIERKENSINEYSEFITLINKNPTLEEIGEAALTKIIKTANLAAGKISLVESGYIRAISTHGLTRENSTLNIELYQRVLEKAETVELAFNDDGPQISSGLVSIKIKYLIIFPIIYNKNVIAILELASVSHPVNSVKEYLGIIKDQLAIGLINAQALRQLENFVLELRNLNEEYQKQNEYISTQNKRLTELHNELREKADELQIQKEKAIEAAAVKSQFLANVSHELKTPLNSILGLTELLLSDRNLSLSQRERLTVVLRNSNKLSLFINDILSFSRIEAGKLEIKKNDFVLADLITELDLQISPLVKEKNIDFIIVNEAENNIVINSDQNKLQQILVNLLSNAVKFTDKGHVKLKITIANNELIGEVEDTGIGIAGEDIKYIFDEFRQVDGTTSRKYNGTGLGLAICHKYTELLGGEIYCTSKPGNGSTFHLAIPILISGINESPSINSERPLALIFENDTNTKGILEKFLTSLKYNTEFSDGNNITDICGQNPEICLFNFNLFLYSWDKFSLLIDNLKCPAIAYYNAPNSEAFYLLSTSDIVMVPFTKDKLISSINKMETLSGNNIENILYIDSSIYSLRDTKSEMKNDKYYFTLSDNEQSAMELLNQVSPDAILVNLCSTGIDGFSLLSKIKDYTTFKNTPVMGLFKADITKEETLKLYFRLNSEATRKDQNIYSLLKSIREKINFLTGSFNDNNFSIRIDREFDNLVNNNCNKKDDKKPGILIVDDDSDTLYTVSEIIRESGYETILARNGVECLNKLRTLAPDLILLDIMMPQMDGFETIKRIRSEKKYKDLPVFALTAKAMFGESDIIMKHGFDDFIPKPVEIEPLISKIKLILAKMVA